MSDGTYTYAYDANGNRTARFVDADSSGTLNSGDTSITEYAWDHRNRLTTVTDRATYGGSATQVVTFEYDAYNRLVHKELDADGDGTGTATDTFWIYDGDQAVLQFDGATAADLSHRYLWGPLVDQLLADETVDDGGTEDVLWAFTDWQGSVRHLASYDESTSVTSIENHKFYDAFGNVASETNSAVDTVFGYTGRMWDDDLDLQNNLNRWYDPGVGRWLTEDPADFAAGDPNLYRYVGNSPGMYVDPEGLEPVELVHSLPPKNVEGVLNQGFKGLLWTRTTNAGAGGGRAWQQANSASITVRVDSAALSAARDVPYEMVHKWYEEGFAKCGTQEGADLYRWGKVADFVKNNKGNLFRVKRSQGSFYIFKQGAIAETTPMIASVKGATLGEPIRDPVLLNRMQGFSRNSVRMLRRAAGPTIVLVAIASDVYEVYTAENWKRELVTKAYGWEGAWIGASVFATAAAAGGQCGPQIAAPEEAVTVPIAGFLGGVFGYFVGAKTGETIYDWHVSRGAAFNPSDPGKSESATNQQKPWDGNMDSYFESPSFGMGGL